MSMMTSTRISLLFTLLAVLPGALIAQINNAPPDWPIPGNGVTNVNVWAPITNNAPGIGKFTWSPTPQNPQGNPPNPTVGNHLCNAKRVLVYVHGYNTGIPANGFTTQTGENIYRGVNPDPNTTTCPVVVFDMNLTPPFEVQFGTAMAWADMYACILDDYVKKLKKKNGSLKINLVSHSLGARVVLGAAEKNDKPWVDSIQMLSAAVLAGSVMPGREFEDAGNATAVKNWHNDEDNVLNSAFRARRGLALGTRGANGGGANLAGWKECDGKPKLKGGADADGDTYNPDPTFYYWWSSIEDDHTSWLYCHNFLACLTKFLA